MSLDPRELRVGNLFHEEVRGHKDLFEIAAFNSLTGTAIDKDDNITSISYLEPIPLTEEWLKKLGFKFHSHEMDHVTYSLNDFKIEDYWQSGKWGNFYWDKEKGDYYLGIEYVHQLQNLYFAMFVEELTLKE